MIHFSEPCLHYLSLPEMPDWLCSMIRLCSMITLQLHVTSAVGSVSVMDPCAPPILCSSVLEITKLTASKLLCLCGAVQYHAEALTCTEEQSDPGSVMVMSQLWTSFIPTTAFSLLVLRGRERTGSHHPAHYHVSGRGQRMLRQRV